MKDFMIILAFMAVVFAACDSKEEETTECDTSVATSTDSTSTPDDTLKGLDPVEDGGTTAADATGVADILADGFPNVSDATEDNEVKDCYSKCVKSDMSKEDCKKACYGDWTKDDNCETCYNKCVKAGKSKLECKEGCCDKKSDPKEADATSTPDDVSETTD
tara:strand:+ start:5802 stop:6287 length:486 start_codon:yes stop_codon:yes gene_type:complete